MTAQTLAAASGYPQLVNALTRPAYAEGFLKRFHHTTIAGMITSQDIIPTNARSHGDEIIFRRAPTATVREFQKNQELAVDGLDTSTVSMFIKRGLYANMKLDTVDKAILGKDLPALMKSYQEDLTQKIAETVDAELLRELPLQAAACNRGRRAGKRSRAFNFGEMGAPVVLTKDNIVRYLSQMRTVLAEQNIDTNGLYVVLPVEAMDLFYSNPILANACASGMQQSIVLGTKLPKVLGFDIIFANHMPQYNENGRVTYTIFAGRKDATGMIVRLNENKHIPFAANHTGEFWRTVYVYDFKMLYPEAVTVLYATLDFAA